MDVWVVIIRNTELKNYNSLSNDRVVGVFSTYEDALGAANAQGVVDEPASDYSKIDDVYLYIEKGTHIKIIKCHVDEKRGGKKSKKNLSKKTNKKQKNYSRKNV
jgi:hypothetical protein